MKTKKERCCGLGHCTCKSVEEEYRTLEEERMERVHKSLNNEFEKNWAKFLLNVEDPEHYMKGQIKEGCRTFFKTRCCGLGHCDCEDLGAIEETGNPLIWNIDGKFIWGTKDFTVPITQIVEEAKEEFAEKIIKKIYAMRKPNRHTEKGKKGELGYLNLNCEDVIQMLRGESE